MGWNSKLLAHLPKNIEIISFKRDNDPNNIDYPFFKLRSYSFQKILRSYILF